MICSPKQNQLTASKNNISFSVYNSVNEFSTAEWNKIAGEKIFLQTNYLQALEQSETAGISFRYVTISENKIPKAIAYFQVADLTSKELGSFINLENYGTVLQAAGNKINDLLFSGSKYSSNNLLVCGSLFVSGEYGIAADNKFLPITFNLFSEIIETISEGITQTGGRVIACTVKDFYEDKDKAANVLTKNNFHRMVVDPNMIFKVRSGWKTFDDYLEAMSAKYRLRANNSMKKIEHVRIKYLNDVEIEKEKDSIDKLYLNVQKKAPVRIVRANINYFGCLKKYLKDQFVFRAFYIEGKMIAFTSGVKHNGHYEAHFIGIDYHYNQSHSIYQNILYDFIHEAIKSRSEELYFGRTAMEIKSTVGAVAHPLFSYFRFSNSLLNRLVKPFIPKEENKSWIPRNPFKE
ncbi:MAG: hypothetical protein ACHQNT_12410 [Bacteroidia bacterium]